MLQLRVVLPLWVCSLKLLINVGGTVLMVSSDNEGS